MADEPRRRSSPLDGLAAAPLDSGLSIDRLAQAFAGLMGGPSPAVPRPPDATASIDPAAIAPAAGPDPSIEIDASPDLDAPEADASCRVSPRTILEAMLFVGLPGGEPITSRRVASLLRGVRPQEIDELAEELRAVYAADNRPYEVASQGAGWVMRLREPFEPFAQVLEERSRTVRLDQESLDVLATVAWNQPVARDRLVELGCDARPATLRQLVRRGLLALSREGDAEPTYATTPKFLELFRLSSVKDLPKPLAPPG